MGWSGNAHQEVTFEPRPKRKNQARKLSWVRMFQTEGPVRTNALKSWLIYLFPLYFSFYFIYLFVLLHCLMNPPQLHPVEVSPSFSRWGKWGWEKLRNLPGLWSYEVAQPITGIPGLEVPSPFCSEVHDFLHSVREEWHLWSLDVGQTWQWTRSISPFHIYILFLSLQKVLEVNTSTALSLWS